MVQRKNFDNSNPKNKNYTNLFKVVVPSGRRFNLLTIKAHTRAGLESMNGEVILQQ